MSCHESLMARRRKKTKKPPSTVQPKVDKSLPALPPSAATSFTPDIDTPSEQYSEPPTADVSPRPPQSRRNESSSQNFRREASPASQNDSRRGTRHLQIHVVFVRTLENSLTHAPQTMSHCPRAPTRRQTTRKPLIMAMTTASCFPSHSIRTPRLGPPPSTRRLVEHPMESLAGTISIALWQVIERC